MYNLLKEIIKRFYFKDRYKLYLILPLSFIAAIFEYMGLIFIFQFIIILINFESNNTKFVVNFFNKYFHIYNFSKIILIIGILTALIYIFKNIYMFIFNKINGFVFRDLSFKISLKIIKNILYQDFAIVNSIDNSQKSGIITKVPIVVWGYCSQYINIITNVLIIIMAVSFLLVKFTLPAVCAFLFMSLLITIEYIYLKYKSNKQNNLYSKYFDRLNKTLYTFINATKEIRLNNKSEYFYSTLKKQLNDMNELNNQRSNDSVFHIHFTEISIMLTFIIIFFVLYETTDFNNKSLILIIAVVVAVILRITPAINRAQRALYAINSNKKIVNEIIEFDKQFPELKNINETKERLIFNNSIELKNASYCYNNSDTGLKNINLKINKGEFIGIVGKSGTYKTTLSLIIAGLIKIQQGQFLIDNNEIKEIDYKKWQNNIAILSQDFCIIKDNIFEDLTNEIINKLELENFNSNPLNLSFGQKQRAALGGILSQNKDIIILDEATSSLDVISENKINNILKDLKGKKTIISIAHRLHILKYCDKIIYMDEGKIIDFDTFKNLNTKYEEFRKMIELSDFKV